jgi:hypothetical protein
VDLRSESKDELNKLVDGFMAFYTSGRGGKRSAFHQGGSRCRQDEAD